MRRSPRSRRAIASRTAAMNSRARGTARRSARNRSRLRRPVSHSAMAGAIGLPSGRREPAIGEVSASRIAQRPPAGGFTNVLEPQPSHLSDLGLAKAPPAALPSPGQDLGIASSGGDGAVVRRRLGRAVMRCRPLGPSRAGRALPAHGGAPAAVEFDPDPARLANDGVSGSDAERRRDVACALSLESELLEVLDGLGGPQHCACSNRCRCGVQRRAEWSEGGYSCPSRTQRRCGLGSPPDFGRISNFFSILKKRIRPQSPIWNSPY